MKIPAMIAAELRRLTSTRMAVVALIALMLVPVLYGGLYLWANQDPYANFAEIPVALVNEDEGVPASADQDAADYGSDVVDELIDGQAFDWRVLTADEAAQALHDGDVDFTVTLPADFSAALTSVSGDGPRQATIELETNDANNYLASTIGTQAVEKIRRSVAELVNREAASRLLDGLAEIRTQLVTAADGASRLADGAAEASDGASKLDDGAAELADGTQQLADGAATLADGAAQTASGATRVADGAAQVADGAAQVADGTATLAGYADRAGAAVQEAADALPDVRSDIADALAAEGLDQTQIDDVLARLDPLGDAIADGNTRVQSAVDKVDQLADGAAQVSSGATQVSSGASQVADATARLDDGAATLADGADAAATGAAQVHEGAASLADGLATLDDGAAQLRDGLDEGVAQIPSSTQKLRDEQAATIADPVAVSSDKVASAADYGAGLAPFFAALAGWIGIYALFLIVKPISRRAVTALHSPIRITVAGWLTPALLGGVGMVALFGVLALALGFGFANPLGTLGIMVLASFTFAAIILALNVWLGSVGQFLGLVLMVAQLVTAGGTFPWQTLPAPLAALHHVLPMGFVVDAMRQLMYGGDVVRVGGDVAVLLTWMLGALVVAAIGVTRMTHRRTLRDLQPSLIG
ncbi:YhgE/Pip family protein [Microbacterium fluvii]|uniref:YhgE/Pip family protein n=1 Tax=Microbacterium fluvii TaxID=415215 RepID=A0ABW2HI27_9MICO|nr:YhgE/Pip domain-containing protein [Microbacterium fluvii]MCU4673786.1 YhgE/Pip domain-containing protein [Microbacterium fluvii]